MKKKFRPISISLSPNVQKDDVVLAFKLLWRPWKWKKGNAAGALENTFKEYLGVAHAISFNSGRSSLYAILQALDLPKQSDVLLQAFTCNAVPNPVLWAGLNPVYVDCGDDFNIDIEDLRRKITPKSRVIVIQHTFGLAADMDKIMQAAKEHNLVVIEDCAHSLGAAYREKLVGTFGDATFYSFSRDKVISSVYGGMAATNNDELGKRLQQLQREFGMPGVVWIKQQILHPIFLHYLILPLYAFLDLGKLFLMISQWLHVLSKAVSWQEKRGLRPDYFPKALPSALATMALHQFGKLDPFNSHRKKIAEFYYQELQNTSFGLPVKENSIFLRFAITHPRAHQIIYDAWHHENILLGDWYTTAIAPHDTDMHQMRYELTMAPKAEALAKQTLNLPTHINISMDHAKRIIGFLKKYV